jgi:hypothetical protein
MSRTWESLHPATRASLKMQGGETSLLDGPTISAQMLVGRTLEGRQTVSHFKCGCDLYLNNGGKTWLCTYHEGFNDGAESQVWAVDQQENSGDLIARLEDTGRCMAADGNWSIKLPTTQDAHAAAARIRSLEEKVARLKEVTDGAGQEEQDADQQENR